MNALELEHPTGEMLIAYGLGQLKEEELAGIDGHLANCAVCRQVVEGVAPDTLLNLLCSAATEPHSTEWVAGAEAGGEAAGPGESGVTAPPAAVPSALMNHPRYRVGELLGVGGMGAVYKAEHLLMERPVALKVLNRELIDKPATIERFRREVRAAARLTHPNIVAAFDAEQAGEVHFLVMEYVEGVSLARRIAEDGPLPLAQACDFVRQTALGLQHAHECGMVHRDIKPQNLMLTPSGQVKILDFGLARFVLESVSQGVRDQGSGVEKGAAQASAEGQVKSLTQTGIVMGTPDYIAPEQARDSHLADIKADIYSLGCTFYHLLAGHPPFPEGNAVQKVKAHLERPPRPLSECRPDVPPALVKIIDQMMAKDAAERFQTPAKVAAALAPFLSAPPKSPRLKKWLALAAGVCFVAALIIYVQTDNGTIVIETNDPSIAVMIEKAGGVKVVDQVNNREYRLRPGGQDLPRGDYRIEVTEALPGLDFQVTKFELKRGKEVRLSAKFVAKGEEKLADKVPTKMTVDPVQSENERKKAKERLENWNRIAALREQEYQKERFNALKAIAAFKEYQYQLGTTDLEEVLAAKSEVAKAELNLAESDTDRVKAHERIVALAQDLVKLREARSELGVVLKVDVLKAKADLLEAQNDLERAKAKTMTPAGVPPNQESKELGTLYRGKPPGFWLEQFKDAAPHLRAEAVEALGKLSQKSEQFIPVVVGALGDVDWNVRWTATSGLGALGPKVVPALVEVIKDKKSALAVSRAADAVGIIGPEAKAAVPWLSQELKIDNEVEWRSPIIALARIGPAAKPAIPALIDFLGDFIKSTEFLKPVKSRPKGGDFSFGSMGTNPLAVTILQALLEIDPEIKGALPKEIFVDGDINQYARATLLQEAYEALKKKFQGQKLTDPADHPGDQAPGKETSKEQGPMYRGKPAGFWLDQLKDADPKFRAEAVEVLGKLSQKNEDLIPVLVTALGDVDLKVGKEASKALGSLGPKVVPVLLEVLKETKSANAFSRAADAVGNIGPKAKAAAPLLFQALKMDNDVQWQSPIYALGRIGPAAKPAIPAMIDFFGEYLKSKEFLKSMDLKSMGVGGKKKPGSGLPQRPLVVTLMEALLRIEPEIKGILPEGIFFKTQKGEFTLTVLSSAPATLWQEAYDALKTKYQEQKPNDPASNGPLTEGRGRRSLEQRVTDAQVIVVATALDTAPAPPKRPGGEASICRV
jgi:tRNA A-37 threonylcarbamoyl transferase component Bud32